jgi:hypothetical protein
MHTTFRSWATTTNSSSHASLYLQFAKIELVLSCVQRLYIGHVCNLDAMEIACKAANQHSKLAKR